MPPGSVVSEADWGAGVRDADALVWVGDFNYRIDAPPGFVAEPATPERSHNDQLYDFVMGKVGRAGRGGAWVCGVCVEAPGEGGGNWLRTGAKGMDK